MSNRYTGIIKVNRSNVFTAIYILAGTLFAPTIIFNTALNNILSRNPIDLPFNLNHVSVFYMGFLVLFVLQSVVLILAPRSYVFRAVAKTRTAIALLVLIYTGLQALTTEWPFFLSVRPES